MRKCGGKRKPETERTSFSSQICIKYLKTFPTGAPGSSWLLSAAAVALGKAEMMVGLPGAACTLTKAGTRESNPISSPLNRLCIAWDVDGGG